MKLKITPLSRGLAIASRKIGDLFTFDRAMILPEWDYLRISCRRRVKRVLDRSVELLTKDERSVKWHVSHGNRTSLQSSILPPLRVLFVSLSLSLLSPFSLLSSDSTIPRREYPRVYKINPFIVARQGERELPGGSDA